MIQEIVK